MKAVDIISMLETRHKDDAFFSEVAINSGQRRMDAWAMKPSYTKSLITAYEVKVSRSDFLHDTKMQEYMPYCNQMYLVAPKGVVKDGELPEGFGFILATEKRLLTKIKAPVREVEIPEGFWRALIVNRLKNKDKMLSDSDYELMRRVKKVNDFTAYKEGKAEFKDIGKHISEKLQRELRQIEYDKEDIARTKERLEEQANTIDTFFEKVHDIFGLPRYQLVRNTLEENSPSRKTLTDWFERNEHPEKDVIKKVDSMVEELEKFKELLRGNSNDI